jgi:hypothetical protein
MSKRIPYNSGIPNLFNNFGTPMNKSEFLQKSCEQQAHYLDSEMKQNFLKYKPLSKK